ncbi:hypothetical protein GCM10025773_13260 [Microbacterium jejuense]
MTVAHDSHGVDVGDAPEGGHEALDRRGRESLLLGRRARKKKGHPATVAGDGAIVGMPTQPVRASQSRYGSQPVRPS